MSLASLSQDLQEVMKIRGLAIRPQAREVAWILRWRGGLLGQDWTVPETQRPRLDLQPLGGSASPAWLWAIVRHTEKAPSGRPWGS